MSNITDQPITTLEITASEMAIRQQLVCLANSMFNRGLSSGGAGNLSVRLESGYFLSTPTNSSFGFLDPLTLSKVDATGNTVSGERASKEILMHLAYYAKRPDVGAVVHLHSPYLTAYSCLDKLNPHDCLPPITPYFVMRVGQLPLVPYIRPGSEKIAEAVSALAEKHQAILLANHGPIIVGKTLLEAVYNAEELEETAKLYFILKSHPHKILSPHDIKELHSVFKR